MEKVKTIIETKHFIECPHCQKDRKRIDHLFSVDGNEISFGPWYCDKCGFAYGGTVKGKEVFIEKLNRRVDKSIVFLKNENVLLCVRGLYFDGVHDIENDRYYYDEGTCPTNYMGNVEVVIDLKDGDADPHGIFKFVASIPYRQYEEMDDVQDYLTSIELLEK